MKLFFLKVFIRYRYCSSGIAVGKAATFRAVDVGSAGPIPAISLRMDSRLLAGWRLLYYFEKQEQIGSIPGAVVPSS